MKNTLLLLYIIMACSRYGTYAQDLRYLDKNSRWTYVYHIPADTVAKLYRDSKAFDHTLSNFALIDSFATGNTYTRVLPYGHYFMVSVKDRVVYYDYKLQTNLIAVLINGEHSNKLFIRTKDDREVTDAVVIFRKRKIRYDAAAHAYRLPFSNDDGRLLTIEAEGEKIFYDYSTNPRDRDDEKERKSELHRLKDRRGEKVNGYVVFNKPRYKPGDTVFYKAYLLHSGHRPYTIPMQVRINRSYGDYGRGYLLLDTLLPSRPGSYSSWFLLGDSFEMDRSYWLALYPLGSTKQIAEQDFRTEDYLLDKYTYSFRLEPQDQPDNIRDTIRMTAWGHDQNGMNVMDGKIRVTAITADVDAWYEDEQCAPDTLFIIEKKLAATGDTKLSYPVDWLPDARIRVTLIADFVNSASEHQQRMEYATIDRGSHQLEAHLEAGTLSADLYEQGHSVAGKGLLLISYDDPDNAIVSRTVSYPLRMPADELAQSYTLYAYGSDTAIATVRATYHSVYLRWSRSDTAITLYRDWDKTPYYYTLYHGGMVFAKGYVRDSNAVIRERTGNTYRAVIQYFVGGEPKTQQTMITSGSKILHVDMQQRHDVYPGRKDTVTVRVTDMKGHEVSGADVTALSINNQFSDYLKIKTLHDAVQQDYRHYHEPPVRESDFDRVDVGTTTALGDAPWWLRRTGIDTMLYYRLLFPHRGMVLHRTTVAGAGAQFAPFLIDHGRLVEIHMIYVDGRLAWYDGTAAYRPYSIPVSDGIHQISLRTTTRLIHLDSIALHDGAKTDMIIELDSAVQHSVQMPPELTEAERHTLRDALIYYMVQRSNDTAYFWDYGSRTVYSVPPPRYGSTPLGVPIGPFTYGKANFCIPGYFNLMFDPLPGYAYSFAPAMTKMEHYDQFAEAHIPLHAAHSTFSHSHVRLGELLSLPPATDPPLRLQVYPLYKSAEMYPGYHYIDGHSSELNIRMIADSTIAYVRLYRADSMVYDHTFYYQREGRLPHLLPGTYDVMAITASGYYSVYRHIVVDAQSVCHATLRLQLFKAPFDTEMLIHDYHISPALIRSGATLYIPAQGTQQIAGRVTDSAGHAISYAAIDLLDTGGHETGISVSADYSGYFSLALSPGVYGLRFADGLYDPLVIRRITVRRDEAVFISAYMKTSKAHVPDVVITAYKRPLIDAADTRIEQSVTSSVDLASVTAGVQSSASNSVLSVNGSRSDEVQYNISGLQKKEKSQGSIHQSLNEVKVTEGGISAKFGDLKEPISLYTDAPVIRSSFSDYAYWQPSLVTDARGQAIFPIRYPDDITSWRSYAIAMTRKHQVGIGRSITHSYKDCVAELAVPQFLLAGDSSSAAIKISDYIHKPIKLKASFTWAGIQTQQADVQLSDLLSDHVPLTVSATEPRKELKASFSISGDDGLADGEERSIAVLQRGTEKAQGDFMLLRSDTSLSWQPDSLLGTVTIRAQSDILDILIDEADHVRRYPYWCMEQIASRLVMLAMLEHIDATLSRPFKLQKEKSACIEKLKKAQLVSGAYGWWEYSPASVHITTYVLSALTKAHVTEQVNTTDAYHYLDLALPLMNRAERLATLELFAEAKHQPALAMFYLRDMVYDSLSLCEQLQYLKTEMLISGGDSMHHWQLILAQRQHTIFGGSYWGDDSWYWYSNRTAATVTAYEIAVLMGDRATQEQIIQFFLETRGHNGWRNTAESAKIVSAILPKVLADRHGNLSSPSLSIEGIETIHTFPFQGTITNPGHTMNITKKGTAPVYLTAYQTAFDTTAAAVTKDFKITTTFRKGEKDIHQLTEGESSEIVVDIDTRKYCEYVMIEVPIPAGCTYGPKPQGYGYNEVHREYLRDRVVIFCESLSPGHQQFHIPIESRYRGSYTVNPAKVQLMYFPVFYGRTGVKRLAITE